MSEVRGRSWEDPMPKGRWPRGVTPGLRSRAAAGRSYPTSDVSGSCRECQAVTAEKRGGATPHPRLGAVAGRSNPTPEARGSGREEQPHVQGAVAVWAQEGLEELFHIQGQEGRQ